MKTSMQTQVKWSVDDYHKMIEAGILDDRKVELLTGEIIPMAPEGPPRTYYGGSLADQFRDKLKGRALVRAGRPITLADSEPEPDVALVKGDWNAYRFRHPYAEDVLLAIEISESSLSKDLKLKRAVYAAAGIKDYWIHNLKDSELIIFRESRDGDYQSEVRLQQGTISPLVFPDISFSVNQLLS